MTRKPKRRRLPEPGHPEHLEPTASGAADGLASGPLAPVPRSYVLLAVCGLLLLAVIAVFGQTARHDFVNFDDNEYVCENRHVKAGLTGEGIVWAMTACYACNWHPLTWISHMLDCQLYGLAPGGHHLTNVLFHAAAAILLFLALRRMTGALWPSAWVAAVFAVHPLRVESVAWVAERKDVLSGLLFMLTLWLYARYAERPASWGRYLAVIGSFALGLTAKPMLVTLPFVLLLLDYWPLGRLGWGLSQFSLGEQRHEALKTPLVPDGTPIAKLSVPPGMPPVRLVVEKIPLFVLAAASCVVTLAAQRKAIQPLEQLSFAGRVAHAAVAYVAYLGKMLCPAGLAVLYPLPKNPPPAVEVVAAVAMLLAISTAAFVARRKCPCLLVGWLWYLGTLVPVIGLVQVGGQAMADRYTYLTQIGLYLAIAWGAMQVAEYRSCRRWGFAAVSVPMMAGLIACAWQQTRHWCDSEILWTHTFACTSQNADAHYNLGAALARRGQIDEAVAQYRSALKIEPDYAMAYNNLGLALADRGQVDEAIVQYRKALEIAPGCAKAHYNLGLALADRGQVDEAIVHYRSATEIEPDYAKAHNNFGLALAGLGRIDEAIAHYRKALEIDPGYAKAHNNLGSALAGRGQIDEAIAHYRKALELKPDSVEALYNLAGALARCGRLGEAMDHYQKALGLALARNDRVRADAIRARIRLLQFAAPAGYYGPAQK